MVPAKKSAPTNPDTFLDVSEYPISKLTAH